MNNLKNSMSKALSANSNNPLSAFMKEPPSQRIAAALQELNDAHPRLLALSRGYQSDVGAIRRAVSENPDLSAEGRQKQLRDRSAQASTAWTAKLNELREDVEYAERRINEAVAANWPKPAPGVEGMLGRQAAWARSRSLLDAGMKISTLIAETTDPETLHALREELPTWARAKKSASSETMANIELRIDVQLAKASEMPADMVAKFEAQALVESLNMLLGHAAAELEGKGHTPASGLSAAVGAHYARNAIQTRLAANIDAVGGV